MAVEDLRNNPMMAHLLDALDEGRDIGHYGRLVFAIVGQYFLEEEELIGYLTKDRDFSEKEARALVDQVERQGYNPPRRDTIREWQEKQDFPILPERDDPDTGNVYRDLEFPDEVYERIKEYHVQKTSR